jgi:hypothetical protein
MGCETVPGQVAWQHVVASWSVSCEARATAGLGQRAECCSTFGVAGGPGSCGRSVKAWPKLGDFAGSLAVGGDRCRLPARTGLARPQRR